MKIIHYAALLAGPALFAVCVTSRADGEGNVAGYSWNARNPAAGQGLDPLSAAPLEAQRDKTSCPERKADGLAFNRERMTFINLGQGENGALRVTGPLTIKFVAQMSAEQKGRAAIVSKWKLADGARSYEIGIDHPQALFFTVTASGKWDQEGQQIVADRPLKPGVMYAVAAVFDPGRRMAFYINGRPSGETTIAVPKAIRDSDTPVVIGNRPGGETYCGFDGVIACVEFSPVAESAEQIAKWAGERGLTAEPEPAFAAAYPQLTPPYDLDVFRDVVRKWHGELQNPGGPYGAYRMTPHHKPDMYASADLAWIRWMMDDLDLTGAQRREWIGFIQDQQNPDGTYRNITDHCPTHAFCHATGALNMLGGRQRYAPAFLNKYYDIGAMPAWLDGIDWKHQWGASHDIWGAGVPIACSPETPDEWRNALFAWLDREIDPNTGFWRKGIECPTPMTYVGGAFHIWPIYAALDRPILYPERVIDSILAMRHPDGYLDARFGYGGMDCVWALQYLSERTQHRRGEVMEALESNLRAMMAFYNASPHRFLTDAHGAESRIATLAITQAALPKLLKSDKPWRNPWHKRENFVIVVEEGKEK
ncbi:MAG TPA: LamG domain-containing protein [Candidatus Brocadiia bacterium]|nr:LamG domain-containing protein [Candidatus Brocadiia bacterium]